jgi:hypothetical protein
MNDLAKITAEARRLGVLSADDRVDRDFTCVECEYNLRTLAIDRNCPECNTPVAETIDARLFVPQQWLERVGRGATVLAVGAGLLVLYCVLLLSRWLGSGLASEGRSPELLLFLVVGLLVAGLLLVTVRPPPVLAIRERFSVRHGVRLAMLTIALALVAYMLFGISLAIIPFAVLVGAFLVLSVLLFRQLAFLASFVGHEALARRLRLGGWCALLASAGLVASVPGLCLPLSRGTAALVIVATGVLAIVLCVFVVPFAVMINKAAWRELPQFDGSAAERPRD